MQFTKLVICMHTRCVRCDMLPAALQYTANCLLSSRSQTSQVDDWVAGIVTGAIVAGKANTIYS